MNSNPAEHITIRRMLRSSGLDIELAQALGKEESKLWLIPHEIYSPELVLAHDKTGLAAAILVTHRPYTAYRKIARVWLRSTAALDAAVEHLVGHIQQLGGVAALKWQDEQATQRDHAIRNGFETMPAPVPSGAGTSHRAGYVRWMNPVPNRTVPYYRQTTEYSCGPVALLMAQSAKTGAPITRADEMRLWRRAAHQPGAGPIALAVYADLGTFQPEVFISTEDVILGEHLHKQWELEVRELFDGEDERAAGELGIPINHRIFSLDEVAAELESGSAVLLLIDEIYFHDDTGSHWILAHTHHEGLFLVNDPWIDADNGDSWVDASDLPVLKQDLEKIAWWGEPAFRGLVVLRPCQETVSPQDEWRTH